MERFFFPIIFFALFFSQVKVARAEIIQTNLPITRQIVSGEYKRIPAALKISRSDTAALQTDLFKEFGIIAINGTDEQSPEVLSDLLFLLRNTFNPAAIRSLHTLRFIYANKGYDNHTNMAAYYLEERAISIGGRKTYDGQKTGKPNVQLIATLAHEIGHAFLFERISSTELKKISDMYGGWGSVFKSQNPESLMASSFFKPHPLYRESRFEDLINKPQWKASNLTSGYATTNIHEWFADAFAAVVLQKLGEKDLLGARWKEKLIVHPKKAKDYWVNYNNCSKEFSHWLEAKAGDTFK